MKRELGDLIDQIDGWMKDDKLLAFGPGHVVFDDYNLHAIDWCIEINRDAIIDRLNNGRVVDGRLTGNDYGVLSLSQLSQSLEYLYILQEWMSKYKRKVADE